MSRTPSPLTDLLTECDSHDIRLLLADDGGLTIDAPQDALTAELLDRVKTQKAALLKLLLRGWDFDVDSAPAAEPASIIDPTPTKAVCRCGGTTCRDVPIHDGQSVRRDCGRCGHFIEFTLWYGMDACVRDFRSPKIPLLMPDPVTTALKSSQTE